MPERRNNRITSLYISYWSLKDPLCQTQSLAYLLRLAARGHRFALLTFEQQKYALDRQETIATKRELAERGIYWYPLRYHKRLSLLATAYDCLRGVAVGSFLAFRHKARIAHSRASIPAAMALPVSRLCGLKFLYDADSALSEEYADVGHWGRGSLAFKMTAWLESLARRASDSAIVLTEEMRQDFVSKYHVRAPVTVIPCCVDTEKFRFDPEARARRRTEIGVRDEKLFIYVGKIGSWYLVDETFAFFKAAQERLGAARLLILTADDPLIFHEAAERQGVGAQDYSLLKASHEEVFEWLSAADAGLAFIRTVSSKRASSPIKVGEYLSVGLPVVITSGIGDTSSLIERERLGAVVNSLAREEYLKGAERLLSLWREVEVLRERCREAAEANFSLERVGAARYRSVYEELLRELT